MISANLPGPDAGALPGLLPGAVSTSLQSREPRSSIAAPTDPHLTDFAGLILLLLPTGASPPAMLPAPGSAPPGNPGGVKDGPPPPLLPTQTPPAMRAAGGSLSPPGGKHLPLATLPAGPVATGSDARLHALAFALPPVQTATATPSPGLSESLATLPAPVNPAGAIPAPELRALLAADVIATDTDALTVAAGDALAAGDTPFTTATVRGAPTTAAVALPATRAELPRFEQALGERLAWLVQEGRHDARIRLHPAELGSIDIRLNQDGDATRISLVSPHAAVRDALEQAVPRLRELLGHAGLDLSQVNVGSGDARSHSDFGRAPAPAGLGPDAGAFAAEPDLTIASVTLRLPQGLVDTFA